MTGWLGRRWNRACAATIGTASFWDLAVDHRSARAALAPLIARHARGVVLDAGAGRLAWRALLEARATRYIAADLDAAAGLDFRCDLQGGIPLPDASVDTIFCCSVLEHAPQPWLVLPEFRRVLAPGGRLILSVPFLYYVHGAPHDYFRFTRHGIESLAHAAGLEPVEWAESGGPAHALAHAASMAWCALAWTPRAPALVAGPVALLTRVAGVFDRGEVGARLRQSVNVVLQAS